MPFDQPNLPMLQIVQHGLCILYFWIQSNTVTQIFLVCKLGWDAITMKFHNFFFLTEGLIIRVPQMQRVSGMKKMSLEKLELVKRSKRGKKSP